MTRKFMPEVTTDFLYDILHGEFIILSITNIVVIMCTIL